LFWVSFYTHTVEQVTKYLVNLGKIMQLVDGIVLPVHGISNGE
jgi:hypothetical protein